MPKTAALLAAVFQISVKNMRGRKSAPPHGPARVNWLNSYLDGRIHSVSINDATSTVQTINAGCPQRSVLARCSH